MRRLALTLAAALALSGLGPNVVQAIWQPGGSGSGYSKASALPAGSTPAASSAVRQVTVSWPASNGAVPVSGYAVKRYAANGELQTVGSGCSGTISGLSCIEQAVPAGEWRYTVSPLNNNWQGTESGKSTAVTVAGPALSLTPSTVTGLPATLSGQIGNFLGGQTVAFRLDNPTTGTALSGSIAPSPVPASGTAGVSVTIPPGTPNGVHTVYAVGSAGDVASAQLTVSLPVTSTIATSAWDVRDASAGAAEVSQSDTSAFAGDGRAAVSGSFATAFSTSRYVQYAFANPLSPGESASSVKFNFSYAGTAVSDTTCFYFDVRRASTGAVLGTHGSAASPVGCTTGTALKATETATPEVTSSEVASDLQVRIYVSSSASHPVNVDLATVSGSRAGQLFTLYESSFVDASTGSAAAAVPWSIYASDSAFYANATSWATTFATSRYLKLSFPAYVPSAATLNSVTFKHSYRSANSGANVCYYFEVYAGTTLLGTHGTSASPVSCTSSSTVWQTDSVALPEVTTVAAANGLAVKLYVNRNTSGKSRHDLAQLQLTYTK
jgi:hypothetical protein